MTTAILLKRMGEAGAGLDASYSDDDDKLYDVLAALANQGDSLSAKSATTGIKASIVLDSAQKVGTLYVRVGTTGTAGQTDVEVRKNGTLLTPASKTVTVLNTEDDGHSAGVVIDDDGIAGDLYEIDFTAVATGVADIAATLRMKSVSIQP